MAETITRAIMNAEPSTYVPLIDARCREIGAELFPDDNSDANEFAFDMFHVTCDHAEQPDVLNHIDEDQVEDLMLGRGVRRSLAMAEVRRGVGILPLCVVDFNDTPIADLEGGA